MNQVRRESNISDIISKNRQSLYSLYIKTLVSNTGRNGCSAVKRKVTFRVELYSIHSVLIWSAIGYIDRVHIAEIRVYGRFHIPGWISWFLKAAFFDFATEVLNNIPTSNHNWPILLYPYSTTFCAYIVSSLLYMTKTPKNLFLQEAVYQTILLKTVTNP